MVNRSGQEVVARCSAAARRADLPPATLRVWERRYGVIGPQRSPAGQRLYTEEDVQRLKLLKRVVDRGYAIGTVARLSTEQLELLSMATDSTAPLEGVPLIRWVIVGQSLKQRLASLAFVMRKHLAYDDVAAAISAVEPGSADVIIVHSPSLREETSRPILALAARNPSSCVAVVYSFGVALAVSQLRDVGIRLLRDPLSRLQLMQGLDDLSRSIRQPPHRAVTENLQRIPRLFNDSALSLIEGRATPITCECPTHLTALISQLSAFETYSDECASPDSRDQALHRHIGDVASHARSMLESVLQRVAAHEGLAIDLAALTSPIPAR